MTAINVLPGSRAVRDQLRSFNFGMGRSIGSHQRRWMQYPRRRPIASSITEFEDEVEQSLPRPRKGQCAGRPERVPPANRRRRRRAFADAAEGSRRVGAGRSSVIRPLRVAHGACRRIPLTVSSGFRYFARAPSYQQVSGAVGYEIYWSP